MAGCIVSGKAYSICNLYIAFNDLSNGVVRVSAKNNGDHTEVEVFKGSCVVGGSDTPTPQGTFHASRWETDHVSSKGLPHENVPYSKTRFGDNAFGPYQLHIFELELRGIYIHGTIGPRNNPVTFLNRLVSPKSHGCVRMSNHDITALHSMVPDPKGNIIVIKRDNTL